MTQILPEERIRQQVDDLGMAADTDQQ